MLGSHASVAPKPFLPTSDVSDRATRGRRYRICDGRSAVASIAIEPIGGNQYRQRELTA